MLALAEAAGRVPSLPGHSFYLLLLQMAALLVAARLGGELSKRLSLPAVVGELAAGIALGPSIFGYYSPHTFRYLFPPEVEQFHLLEVISNIGMVLLLLLTGLETDVRMLKNLGRPALAASVFGLAVPFIGGFALGYLVPVELRIDPGHAERHLLFAFFLATALSVSAMPVIAKILMDLDLTKRNIGLMILSAGVVDDTLGWLILSVIAGAATTGSANVLKLGQTVGLTVGFLAAAVFVLYPVLRWFFKLAHDNFRSKDTDLVLIIVVTFACAAITEKIGVHAVFGAFIAGVVMRQVPRLSHETVHKLESVTMSVFAPIFFGVVGLKVNLQALHGAGWFLVVLGFATLSKLVGCTLGARWGGLGIWESLSIAVAMNARGAMGLVVASIGLSLGILNEQMFTIIVLVAIATSFMAPLGLRITMSQVKMTDDERERLAQESAKEFFDPHKLRILLPTAGGPNALLAARIGYVLARASDSPLGVLYINPQAGFWARLRRLFRPRLAGVGIEEHFEMLRTLAGTGAAPNIQKLAAKDVAAAIIAEASKGYDLVMLGASRLGSGMRGDLVEDVVENIPCHLAVMKPVGDGLPAEFKHILVPVDGSLSSRAAVDFAVMYADRVGGAVTLLFLTEKRSQVAAYADEERTLPEVDTTQQFPVSRLRETSRTVDAGASPRLGAPLRPVQVPTEPPLPTDSPITGELTPPPADLPRLIDTDPDLVVAAGSAAVAVAAAVAPAPAPAPGDSRPGPDATLSRISPIFNVSKLKPTILSRSYDPLRSAVAGEARSGKYDLIVVGAENRAIKNRLFFGYENERLLTESPVSVLMVVPKIGARSS